MNKHTEHNDNEQRINRNSQPRKQQPTIKNQKTITSNEPKAKNMNESKQQNKNKKQPQRTQYQRTKNNDATNKEQRHTLSAH